MKSKFITINLVFSLAFLFALAPAGEAAKGPLERKIVIFTEDVQSLERDEVIAKAGGYKIKDLDLISAVAAYLPASGADEALASTQGVVLVEDDFIVEALAKGPSRPEPTSSPTQVLPWGVDRIDAELVWPTTTVADLIKVAIIDTGIDLKHPDLAANIKGGVNTINPTKTANDDNGHGTHVAGTVAALNNSIGVVGAGPMIDLYAVKVLNKKGFGFISDIVEGLDWAIANGMQVVNMSFGSSSLSASLQAAVKRVNAAGIVQVAAAGNSGPADNTVIYPAKFPEVIAVSATDSSDNLASFSSRGPEVDLAAPGVSIFSTYRGQTYRTLSGTSMASPHVAGTAALLLSVPAKCDTDLSGACSPTEVQSRLEATARDLGAAGKDNLFGAGLVDALKAVTN